MPIDTRRLRHLATEINPREAGLTPSHIAFTREESPPVTSMLDDGLWYTHPERQEEVIAWSKDEAALVDVLNEHDGRSWRSLKMLPRKPAP